MLIGDKTLCGVSVSQLGNGSERKVRLRCDLCGKETVTSWSNYCQYRRKSGGSDTTKCQRCAVKITTKGKHREASATRGEEEQAERRRETPVLEGWIIY